MKNSVRLISEYIRLPNYTALFPDYEIYNYLRLHYYLSSYYLRTNMSYQSIGIFFTKLYTGTFRMSI